MSSLQFSTWSFLQTSKEWRLKKNSLSVINSMLCARGIPLRGEADHGRGRGLGPWSSTPSPGEWSPTWQSTSPGVAVPPGVFFCFRILTELKPLYNFLAWRWCWCSIDRPRKTNYYLEVRICSFILNLGQQFFTPFLQKNCLEGGGSAVNYDRSTLHRSQVWKERNQFYCWGFR